MLVPTVIVGQEIPYDALCTFPTPSLFLLPECGLDRLHNLSRGKQQSLDNYLGILSQLPQQVLQPPGLGLMLLDSPPPVTAIEVRIYKNNKTSETFHENKPSAHGCRPS